MWDCVDTLDCLRRPAQRRVVADWLAAFYGQPSVYNARKTRKKGTV